MHRIYNTFLFIVTPLESVMQEGSRDPSTVMQA